MMKCPKCAYVSHDYLDTCRNSKCGNDLIDFKAQMQLYAVQAGTISLMSILGHIQNHAAVAGRTRDSQFDSQMLIDTNNTGDFDISLDDDFSLDSTAININGSADISGAFNISNLNFGLDAKATGAATGGQDQSSTGRPTSGYATIMLDVGHFEDPTVSQDGDGVPSDPSTSHYTGAPLDVSDLDLGATHQGSDSPLAPPVGQDLFADTAPDTTNTPESVDANIIPGQNDEVDLTVHSDDMSLLDDLTDLDQRAAPSSENPQSGKLNFQTTEIQLPPIPETEVPVADTLDATAIDDTHSITLTDNVFERLQPSTQDITLGDPIDAPAINDANAPAVTDHEERFELPPLPDSPELSLSSSLDPTVADTLDATTLDATIVDEFASISQDGPSPKAMQLLDESVERPELLNTKELTFTNTFDETMADISSPTLPGNPLTRSIPLDEGAFELPPLSAQEITHVDNQESAAVEPSAPPVDNRTHSIPLEDMAFELPSPHTETDLQFFGAQDETVVEDSPLTGFNTYKEALSHPLPFQIDDDSDLFQAEDEALWFGDEPPPSS